MPSGDTRKVYSRRDWRKRLVHAHGGGMHRRRRVAAGVAVAMLVLVFAGIVAYDLVGGGICARAENAPLASNDNSPQVIAVERPPAEAMATKNHAPFPLVTVNEAGEVRFLLAEFGDDAAHFFTVMIDGRPIEFFVLRSSDGVIRAAFNACDVCYREKLGYTQDGQVMVCNNCGNRFPADRINVVRGGCNPAPLDRRIDAEELVITAESLAGGLRYFPVGPQRRARRCFSDVLSGKESVSLDCSIIPSRAASGLYS